MRAPMAAIWLVASACEGPAAPVELDVNPPAPPPSAQAYGEDGPYGVGVRELLLADPLRTLPPTDVPRPLPTLLWYPADDGTADEAAEDVAVRAGRFPLVLLAHGYLSAPGDHAGLGRHLASHGYIVAAPTFPLTSREGVGGPAFADVTQQPGDLSYVLDRVLAGDGDVAASLDTMRVGVVGMSLGGLTGALIGLHPEWGDARVDALVLLAPALCALPVTLFQPADPAQARQHPPTLIAHGTADRIVPYEANAVAGYAALRGPKVLVTLDAGTHTGFPDATAELFDALPDPDTAGCGAIGDVGESTSSELPPRFFGLQGDALSLDCPAACSVTTGEGPRMRPTRQRDLSFPIVRGFLDGWLRNEPTARRVITGSLAAEPDVTVEAVLSSSG